MKTYFVTWNDFTGKHTAMMFADKLALLRKRLTPYRCFFIEAIEQDYL